MNKPSRRDLIILGKLGCFFAILLAVVLLFGLIMDWWHARQYPNHDAAVTNIGSFNEALPVLDYLLPPGRGVLDEERVRLFLGGLSESKMPNDPKLVLIRKDHSEDWKVTVEIPADSLPDEFVARTPNEVNVVVFVFPMESLQVGTYEGDWLSKKLFKPSSAGGYRRRILLIFATRDKGLVRWEIVLGEKPPSAIADGSGDRTGSPLSADDIAYVLAKSMLYSHGPHLGWDLPQSCWGYRGFDLPVPSRR